MLLILEHLPLVLHSKSSREWKACRWCSHKYNVATPTASYPQPLASLCRYCPFGVFMAAGAMLGYAETLVMSGMACVRLLDEKLAQAAGNSK